MRVRDLDIHIELQHEQIRIYIGLQYEQTDFYIRWQ
jgi:hypothetical protein